MLLLLLLELINPNSRLLLLLLLLLLLYFYFFIIVWLEFLKCTVLTKFLFWNWLKTTFVATGSWRFSGRPMKARPWPSTSPTTCTLRSTSTLWGALPPSPNFLCDLGDRLRRSSLLAVSTSLETFLRVVVLLISRLEHERRGRQVISGARVARFDLFILLCLAFV